MVMAWPAKCTLMGCTRPHTRPHHHHWYRGHIMIQACSCGRGGEPGTSPPESEGRRR